MKILRKMRIESLGKQKNAALKVFANVKNDLAKVIEGLSSARKEAELEISRADLIIQAEQEVIKAIAAEVTTIQAQIEKLDQFIGG